MQFLISDTFTDSLTRLTADEQKSVKTTAFDLQTNPAHPSLKFHKLDRAKDRRFWSVRAGSDVRLIVHKTDAMSEISMAALVVILLCFGVPVSASWLLVVPVLTLQFLFNAGVAMVVARMGAKTPDLAQLMPFVMRTWMYASGVMFSIPIMLADKPQWTATVLQWNPASIYMDLMRFSLIAVLLS